MKGWNGLCLALIIGVGGCVSPPETVFSPDTSRIAFSAGGGIAIRETADLNKKSFFKVGPASGLSWSPAGRYLVWMDDYPADIGGGPPDNYVLDLNTQTVSKLPVHLKGPFTWPGEAVFMGFEEKGVDPSHLETSETSAVRYDVAANKSLGEQALGPYAPVIATPFSREALFIGKGPSAWRLSDKGMVPWVPIPRDLWQSSGIDSVGLLTDDAIYVTGTQLSPAGYRNSVAVLNAEAKRTPVDLPPSLERGTYKGRQIRKILSVSPDLKWLVTIQRQDISRKPVIPRLLLLEQQHPMARTNKALSDEDWALHLQAEYLDTYQLVDRQTGRGRDLLTASGDNPSVAQATWTHDGRWLALGVRDARAGRHEAVVDLQTGKVTPLSD